MRILALGALGLGALLVAGAASTPDASAATAPVIAPVADAALAADAPPQFAISPVGDVVVVEGFDPPDQPWLAGHRGVDLAAARGTEVVADRDGVVVFAGRVVDRSVITILHADGSRSSFEPVAATVEIGAAVEAGDPVGLLTAEASHCGEPCLHWGVRVGDAYVDPLATMRGHGPIDLLPRSAGAPWD